MSAIEVDRLAALSDVDPGIRVTGSPATLQARAVDAAGCAWRSSMPVADLAGDPLGPLWRLAPADPSVDRFTVDWTGFAVTLAADGAADVTLRRRFAGDGVTREAIDADGLVGTLFLPAGPGPHPALAMYHGSGGGVPGLEPSGALLASHGCAALVVGWFGAGDTPPDIRRVSVESLERAVTCLRADPRIDPARVGLLGTSAGGEAVMTLASTRPQLAPDVVIVVAGSSVVWQALVDGRPPAEPRYTLAGADLPWAPVVSAKLMAQMLVENPLRGLLHRRPELHTLRAYAAGLEDERAAAAQLPAERIDAPLLLFAGAEDEVWPAARMARDIAARRGDRPDDRVVVFPGTGHISLRPPALPTTVLRSGELVFGGEPAAFAAAMSAVWSELLGFLDHRR